MTVYLLCKHPPYLYNHRVHLAAAEVMGVYVDRAEPAKIAKEKNAKPSRYFRTVKRKQVKA